MVNNNNQSDKKDKKIALERRGRRATKLMIAMSVLSLMMVFAGPLSAAPSILAQRMVSSNNMSLGGSNSITMENMVLILVRHSSSITLEQQARLILLKTSSELPSKVMEHLCCLMEET